MNELLAARSFDSLFVGEESFFICTISPKDVEVFAELSGDHNPLHIDSVYAKTTAYQKPIVHGMFLGALVSRLVGMQLPGKYALLMREFLEFKKPVMVGDTIQVKGTISQKSEATRIVAIEIVIVRELEVVAKGLVHVKLLQ